MELISLKRKLNLRFFSRFQESMSFDFTEFCDSYSLYPTGKVSPVDSYVTELDNEEIRDNYAFLDSVLKDNKSEFISHAKRILVGEDAESERIEAIKLLSACCSYDSINCASSIINGDVGSVPYINDVCSDTGLSPLHTAAEYNALRCVEMLLKRRARTDMRSKDERALIPLELSLSNGSIDVTWNASSDSIGDLIVLLGDKDLTVVKLLAEKTKEVDAVAFAYAKAGEIVSLTALLIVASEKIREATVALRDDDDSVPKCKRETIYEAVIQEALRSNSSTQSVCSEKRMVFLREIELLQLFGAAVFSESVDKQTSPLISIVQAGDEAVLELFINTNLDVNEKDAEGNTVLQCSLKGSSVPHKQQTRIMSLLIAHGARVNQRNKLGLSAVHFAAANGNLSALEILLAANPELVNVKTVIKETPLFFAVKNNHLECVELLLRCGASIEIHNLRKETELAQPQSAAVPTDADDEETLGFLGNSVPPWLKSFVNWLPRYLRDTSANWRGAGYPLSSLKADFRAVFGMDLDHASLGFPKLIDFIKYFPKLCQMKVVPIGKIGAATHWVMLPTKSKSSQLKGRPPEPLIISKNDSVASPDKPKALSVPPGFKFLQEAHDSKTFKAPPEPKPQPPPPLTTASSNNQRQLKHPVLETLTRIRNSTSVFFLREFDFYQSYETCLKEGMCFWCNKNMLLWANFPCRHKLWCSSCKQQVTQSALGEKSLEEDHHKCVVCDAKVERFVLSPPFESDHHRLSSDRPNNAELATSFLQFLSIRNSMNKMIHRGI
ncbi:hypothetical protein ARALYDRAFT_484658 [Arabidopsis lyrata subsp. lyrata]|uniref:HTH OST-type domain-containing protein n=1 Tax=Arabidopsis lyrata subsp. lyrata TaxID=81972 RepID=D7LM55_ARALL|nr:hypothetical protein ARALYDRAFT_484658 [Arabidopsis lyrata subsp. lyrata]